MSNFIKSDTAKEYRLKYGMQMPTLALARIMYNENKELFINVDNARSALRYIEGKRGKKEFSKNIEQSPFFMQNERPRNPYNLPDSDETKYEPYYIKAKKLAVLSDVHIPYHSIDAITATFDKISNEKPDAILLNGDFIDFYGLSRFMKDPRKRSVAHELQSAREVLDILATFGAKIYFKLGNHEERYEHFLMQKAPELLGIQQFELRHLLGLDEKGIDLIGDKRIIKANDLNIVHGHEFGQSIFSPVNVARGLFLRGKVTAMQGHNHSVSEHTESDMNGNIVTTWSLGCLCELNPAYLPINKWSHGFAIVDLHDNGKDFHVYNYRIHKGKIL
jgi:predicted phosphodiesterase